MQGKKDFTPQLFYDLSLDRLVPSDNFLRIGSTDLEPCTKSRSFAKLLVVGNFYIIATANKINIAINTKTEDIKYVQSLLIIPELLFKLL